MAAEAASFKTCNDSISPALTSFKFPGAPSIITNGALSENELIPRILILTSAPGAPDEVVTLTPGVVPSKALATLGRTAPALTWSTSTIEIELLKSFFFCDP